VPKTPIPAGRKGGVLRRLARATWALLAAGLLSGCLDATQIELELTTDVNCADRPETAISVGTLGQLESSPPVAVTTACEAQTGRIGSLVVLPHDSKEGQVAVEVVAGIAKTAEECRRDRFVGGCIVARRMLNFVKHRSLRLPIELEAACVDVPCGSTETCRRGSCVSAEVDPDSCLTGLGCMIDDAGDGSGGDGSGGDGSGGGGDGGSAGGASSGGGPPGGADGGAGGSLGDGGQVAAAGETSVEPGGQSGTAGQSSAGTGGTAGQSTGGTAGQSTGGAAGQSTGGAAGQSTGGTAGQSTGGAAGQSTGGAAGQSTGGAPQLGPVVVASDNKSSNGLVSVISPSKALLPEQPGDLLFAWVCIASEFGSATPKNNAFWRTYTTAPGRTLLLAQVRCQAFTATATGGSESHDFSIFPASSATIQRLEVAGAKPPPASPPFASGYPGTNPNTSAMSASQDHSLLVYFLGVSGSTTLGSIKIGASGRSTTMQQLASSGINTITSGIAIAFDEPRGTAPIVTYAPADSGVWSSAGVVLSPGP
jgi:hypothetical protein